MVAAPLLATGVAIDLPETKAAALNIDQKPVSVAIDEKGDIYLMDQPVRAEDLVSRLQAAAKAGFDERIYVRGARDVNYGRVAQVMAIITTAGFKKVALVTEQEKK
jgi:biopolymer transport protein TolR